MKTSIRTIWGTFWHLDSNSKVIQTTSDDHKFELVSLGNGNIAFRGPNNKFVCAEDEGKADYLVCDRDGAYAWEEFKPEPDYGGQAYKGVNGRYIAAEDNRYDITINRERADAWEAFWTEAPPIDTSLTIEVRDKFFWKKNGERLNIIQNSEFSLYKYYLDGQNIQHILEERKALGFNCLRVWLLNTSVIPGGLIPNKYPEFYKKLAPFAALCSAYGFYVEFTVFTQTKSLMPGVNEQQAALQGVPNVLLELVNEYDQHDNDCSNQLSKPKGIISSHGSGGSDALGKQPFWDYTQYHTNTLSEWQRKVGHNAMEIADEYRIPCISNENKRYPDNDSSSIHAYDAAAGATLLTAGACYHSQGGKFSRLFNDVEKYCAMEWVRGAKSIDLAYREGLYRHESDMENDQILRAYSREIPGSKAYVLIRY
jgi:hypothetical protein